MRSVRQAFHLIRGLELLGWRAKAKTSLGLAEKQLQGFLVSNEIKIIALKLTIFGGHNHFRLTDLFC